METGEWGLGKEIWSQRSKKERLDSGKTWEDGKDFGSQSKCTKKEEIRAIRTRILRGGEKGRETKESQRKYPQKKERRAIGRRVIGGDQTIDKRKK